jgi:hypothetical protein
VVTKTLKSRCKTTRALLRDFFKITASAHQSREMNRKHNKLENVSLVVGAFIQLRVLQIRIFSAFDEGTPRGGQVKLHPL